MFACIVILRKGKKVTCVTLLPDR